jgi:hypothetical protein
MAKTPSRSSKKPKPVERSEATGFRKFIALIPGGIATIAGSVAAVLAAAGAAFTWSPARVQIHLQCHPDRIEMTATNRGGQKAYLREASFRMLSPRRFPEAPMAVESFSTDAFDDPLEGHRDIGSGEARTYSWIGLMYGEEELKSVCGYMVTVEFSRGRSKAGLCQCQPS